MIQLIFSDPQKSTASSPLKVSCTLKLGEESHFLSAPHLPDKTVSVSGIFGGALVLIRDGNGATLRDVNGNALSFSSVDSRVILENPDGIQAFSSGGDGTTLLSVVFVCTGPR